MILRFTRLGLVALFLVALGACRDLARVSAAPGSLLELSGGWTFCPSAEPLISPTLLECQPIEVPGGWEQIVEGYDGFGLLRTTFDGQQLRLLPDLGLYIEQVRDADQVYLNGRLIGQTGQFPPAFQKATLYPRLYRVPKPLLLDQGNVLELWVYNNARPGGIYDQAPLLGDYSTLRHRIEQDNYKTLVFVTALVVFALLHLVYFVFRRRSWDNVFYTVFLLAWSTYVWTYSEFAQLSGLSLNFIFRSNVALFFVIFATLPLFIFSFLSRPMPLLLKVVIGTVLVGAAFVMVVPNLDWIYPVLEAVEVAGVLIALPCILWVLARAVKERRPYAKVFSAVLLLYIGVGMVDILLDLTQLALPFIRSLLGPYALIVLSTALTFIMSHKHWSYYRDATFDPLTGALRRNAFIYRVDQQLAAIKQPTVIALAMVDMDNFKQVNDSFGHLAGDQLLMRVAAQLRKRLAPDDYLGRFGGDEFCIAVVASHRGDAMHRVRELHEELAALEIGIQPTQHVSATIGATLFDPEQHRDTIDMIADADQLLIHAKARQKGQLSWTAAVPDNEVSSQVSSSART